MRLALEQVANLLISLAVRQGRSFQLVREVYDGIKGDEAPHARQDSTLSLHVEQDERLEGLSIHQVSVLLMMSKLAIDEFEGVEREACLIKSVDGTGVGHVLRRTFIELDSFDVAMQIQALQVD